MAISHGPRCALRRVILVCAAAASIGGCGRPASVAPTPYDAHPVELRTPAQFGIETEVFEVRLARLRLDMEQPDAMERPREMMGAVESAQRPWRRIAGHFSYGFGNAPFPMTDAYRHPRDRWVASLGKVSESLNDVLRFVGENRILDALNSMYDTRVALDDLWSQAGFARPEIRAFKLKGLLGAARDIPPGRRAAIAEVLDAELAKAMRYLTEDAMAGVTVKEIAVERMLALTRLQSSVHRARDAIRSLGTTDRFPERCDDSLGLARELEKAIAPAAKGLADRRE